MNCHQFIIRHLISVLKAGRGGGGGQSAHGVPGGQGLDVLPEGLHDVGRHDRLVHDDLEDVLFEPVGSHHEIALLVAVVAPRVLHAPLDGIAFILRN